MTSVNPGKVPDIFLSYQSSNLHHGSAVRSLFAVPHPLLSSWILLTDYASELFHGVLINEKSPWQSTERWSKSSRNAHHVLHSVSWTWRLCVPSSVMIHFNDIGPEWSTVACRQLDWYPHFLTHRYFLRKDPAVFPHFSTQVSRGQQWQIAMVPYGSTTALSFAQRWKKGKDVFQSIQSIFFPDTLSIVYPASR